MEGNNHYIRTNEAGVIILGFSDAFDQPQEGDILILEAGPRHFHQAWPALSNERGQFLYRWQNGSFVVRTKAELDAEWAARPPEPKSPIEQKTDMLDERTIGMQDIDFFTLQQTDNLDQRTQGMQDIDQFTLDQVMDLQAKVDDLQAQINILKGGA